MTTNDIELRSAVMGVITDVWDRVKQIDDAADEVLDLIEADRKRRGERVVESIEKLAINRYRPVPAGLLAYKVVAGDGSRSLFSGTKDECKIVAAKLTEAFLDGAHVASQPNAQVRKTDWNNKLSSWGDDDFVRVFHERPDLVDRLRKMLAEPVKHKRPYAQGTALGEFGIIPMCDQVDE